MKKRLFALVLALVLVFSALPAVAGSFNFDFFTEMMQEEEPQESLVLTTKTPKATDTPKATEKPVSVSNEELTTPYGKRIFDQGNLFSSTQEEKINEQIIQFQKETGMDFVVVTYNGPMKKATAQDEADVFYEDGCKAGILGNVEKAGDDEDSGMLIYINPYTGDYHVSTTGKMIDYITDERASRLDSTLISNLRSARTTGDYARCVTDLLSGTTRYVKDGIPEGQYQYDVLTGQQLTPRHKALTGMEMLVSAIIGVVVCVIMVSSVNSQYSLKHNTYEYSVRNNAALNMRRSGDQYIRSSVNRVRRPDNRSSGGGFGGGGFSGGSGVHTSSGGGSHGGFGGKF